GRPEAAVRARADRLGTGRCVAASRPAYHLRFCHVTLSGEVRTLLIHRSVLSGSQERVLYCLTIRFPRFAGKSNCQTSLSFARSDWVCPKLAEVVLEEGKIGEADGVVAIVIGAAIVSGVGA